MPSVDDRIVAMKFDNRAFDQKISGTIRSLNQLQKSLDFSNSARGLQDLTAASNKFSLVTMADALDGIASKFTAMGIIGITTLTNLVNKAVDAGSSLAKSLSIDPLTSGFEEYQTNINSIQTILANTSSKGTTLDDVNTALQELNAYSDKTIYNFSQMAKNIGTFTAAGVDLDTAVGAIKGIANLAALSGASAEQASTAMYQLSQAISTGTVRLIDWNSVQNASIGGEVFQKALFETGKALGTIKGIELDTTFEQWKEANGSFRDSLSGTGEQVQDEASIVAKGQADAAKIISDAELQVADDTEEANRRVEDAKKRVVDAAVDGADAIARASKRQSQMIEDDAKSVKEAWQSIIDARKRLENAMKPASENELEAAQDRVTSSKLDQADLADAITRAEQDQTKALSREHKARLALADATASGDLDAQNKAYFELQDAVNAVADASDAVTRAQLAQKAAARDVTNAEETLQEVQNKGSESDQNVINAKENLESAEQRYIRELEDSSQRQKDAAEDLASAREDSAQRQEDAARNLSTTEKNTAEDIIQLQERLAKAHEDAALIISNSGADAENAWLTSDVLTTTLQAFTGDLDKAQLMALGYSETVAAELETMGKTASESATSVKTLTQLLSTVKESIGSGWSESFTTIFGTFDEAKGAFTLFNNQIGDAAKGAASERNAILAEWKKLGGRDDLFAGITQAFKTLNSYLKPIKDAFRDIFPRKTGAELAAITKRFLEFTKRMQASSETADKIKRIFKGVFAAFSIGVTIIKNVAHFVKELLKVFSGAAGSPILELLGGVADNIVLLDKRLKEGKGLETFFNFLLSGAKKIGSVLGFLIGVIKDAFGQILSGALTVGGAVRSVFAKMGEFFSGLTGGAFDKVAQLFKKVTNSVKELTKSVGGGEDGRLGGGLSYLSKIGNRLSDIWSRLAKFTGKLKDKVVELSKEIGPGLTSIFKKITEVFGGGNYDKTLDLINVGLLGGVVLLFKRFLDGGFIAALGGRDFTKSIKGMFNGVTDVLKSFQTSIKAGALLKIGQALAVVVASLLVLSLIDSKKLTLATVAMTAVLGGLVYALHEIAKIGGDGPEAKSTASIVGLTAALGVLAGALVIMSGALTILSKIDAVSLAEGLLALKVMTTALSSTLTTLSKADIKNPVKLVLALLGVTKALSSMAGVVEMVGKLSVKEAAQGMLALEGMIEILVNAFQRLPKKEDGKVAGMLLFAGALQILAWTVEDLGSMDPITLAQGLAALAVVIKGVVMLFQSLAKTEVTNVGGAMAGVAAGLLAIGFSLKILSTLSIDDLAKSIGTLAVVLPILATAMYFMAGAYWGGQALAIAAVGLVALAYAFKLFHDVDLVDIGKGLLVVVGVVGALVAAAFGIAAVAPALIALSPALVALGVPLLLMGGAFALFGLGALGLAKAFEIVANTGEKGIKVFKKFLELILGIIPEFIGGVAKGILSFAELIAENAPGLIKSFVKIIIQVLQGIRKILPELGKTIGEFIDTIIKLLIDKGPDVAVAGFKLLLDFLKGLADNTKELTATVSDIIVKFLEELSKHAVDITTAGMKVLISVLEGIAENIALVVEAAGSIITTFIEALGGLAGDIVTAGANALISFLDGITESIPRIAGKITEIVVAITTAIANEVPKVVDAGFKMFIALFDGLAQVINENSGELGRAMGGLASALVKGIGNALKEAIKQIANDLFPGLGSIVSGILDFFGIASPSKLFYWIGEMLMTGLDNGVKKNFDKPVNSLMAGSEVMVDTMSTTMSRLADALNENMEFDPKITPVLDLTQVKREAGSLDGLFNNSGINASVSVGQANALSVATQANAVSTLDDTNRPVVQEVRFEQTINAPTQLSTGDIYRQTKSQIIMAKKELTAA